VKQEILQTNVLDVCELYFRLNPQRLTPTAFHNCDLQGEPHLLQHVSGDLPKWVTCVPKVRSARVRRQVPDLPSTALETNGTERMAKP
jgi:hypothetical protein